MYNKTSLNCDKCYNNSVTTTVSQVSQQKCHNNTHKNSVKTTVSQQQCHNNSVTTTVSQQQCHNSKFVIFQESLLKVLKCRTSLSATTKQMLSSGIVLQIAL